MGEGRPGVQNYAYSIETQHGENRFRIRQEDSKRVNMSDDIVVLDETTPDDTMGPTIAHSPIADGARVGSPIVIQANVTDASRIASVSLYYRIVGAATSSALRSVAAPRIDSRFETPGLAATS